MTKKKKMSAKTANRIADIIIYTFIALISLTCLFPFVHVFAKSISEEAFVIANKVFLIPKGFSLDAYKKVFSDASIIYSFYVSVVVTILFTALGMVITLCAAYPLSRRSLKPEYLLMNSLHLLDTWAVMILPLAFSPYNLLIMKTSLQSSIPESLIESAHLEGANELDILTKIVVPLSKPIMATLALFYAVGRWNAYQDALFYIKQNVSLRPLQLKLYYLVVASTESFQTAVEGAAQLTNPEVLKAACIIFATVPILCIYPFIQKYFVQGTMIGSVKE